MLMDRLQVGFTGSQMGSGVATHYAVHAAGHRDAFAAFWQELGNRVFPDSVWITVPNSGDVIEVESGLLQSVWTEGATMQKQGANGPNHAAGCGAAITWVTASIINGKRVRGRTFIVPIAAQHYDSDGTINDAARSFINAATLTLLGACGEDFLIYHRGKGDEDGVACPVISHRLADRVATLRTRR